MENGRIEEGFAVSDHVIEGEMHVGGQEHFYMETQAALAVPKKENGEMEIYSQIQGPDQLQVSLSKLKRLIRDMQRCSI